MNPKGKAQGPACHSGSTDVAFKATTPRVRSYGRQVIDDDDIQAVIEVLRSGFLTTGPAVEAFERALTGATTAPHAVVVSSGTAALHLAVLAADVGPADVCIVPALTFVATANAVRYAGAEVVFADCDPDTGLMRPEDLEHAMSRASTHPVKAVLPVHLNGQTVDLSSLASIAAQHNQILIEDASHALGTDIYDPTQEWLPVGACRHDGMAIFSMHAVKNITMGEGGAVTTNDAGVARRLKLLRNHGITREADDFTVREDAFDASGHANPWYYALRELGFNYRATDIQCALGLSQLRKQVVFAKRRRDLHGRYCKTLVSLAPHVTAVPQVPHCRPVWHLMVVLIDFAALGTNRADVMRGLASRGIGSQVHYLPVHRQPYYCARYGSIHLPGADRYYDRCLSLPLHADMTVDDVDQVVAGLADVLGLSSEF
jgi:UDP-4-amino-4,6-dideoxy-N-acetyl-beta-L-altrosamine transaminase